MIDKEELQTAVNDALIKQQQKNNTNIAILGVLLPIIAALFAYFAGASATLSTEKSILSTEKAIQLASKELGKKFDDKVELFEQRIRTKLNDNQQFQQSLVNRSIDNAGTISRALLLSEEAQAIVGRVEKSYLQIRDDEKNIIGLREAAKDLVENKAGIKPKHIAQLLEQSVKNLVKDSLSWKVLPEKVSYFNAKCEYRLMLGVTENNQSKDIKHTPNSLRSVAEFSNAIAKQRAIYPTAVNSLSLTSIYNTTMGAKTLVVSAKHPHIMLVNALHHKPNQTKQPPQRIKITTFERCLGATN